MQFDWHHTYWIVINFKTNDICNNKNSSDPPRPFVKTKIAFRKTECWILEPLSAPFSQKSLLKTILWFSNSILSRWNNSLNSFQLKTNWLPGGILLRKIMVFWENGFGIYNRTTASCAALLSSWPVQYGPYCDGIIMSRCILRVPMQTSVLNHTV